MTIGHEIRLRYPVSFNSEVSKSFIGRADDKGYRTLEVVEPAPPAEEHAPGTNGFATPVEIKRIRQLPASYQNWSDLFFVMDVMSNSVDICDILIFISKTDDLVPVMDDKKVDVHLSRLDVATNTLTVSYTNAGIIEKLLGKSKSIRHIQQPFLQQLSNQELQSPNFAKLGQH